MLCWVTESTKEHEKRIGKSSKHIDKDIESSKNGEVGYDGAAHLKSNFEVFGGCLSILPVAQDNE